MNRSNSLRVLTLLSLAFLLVSMSTDANAARRSALGGNQFIDDRDDMFAFPQLLLKYNNSVIFDFAPSPGDSMTARGTVTFGDNWVWQFNTGRADYLDNTAWWAWGGTDRMLDRDLGPFDFDRIQWWDVGVAHNFGDTPVGFNISWAADGDKTTNPAIDPSTSEDESTSMLSFQLGADLLNANWAIETGFGSFSDNLNDQNDESFFELAIAARGKSFEAGGVNWRWLAAFATYSADPNADGVEKSSMTAFRGNFGPVWGTPGEWLVGAYIYFAYLSMEEANSSAANAKDTLTAFTLPGYNFAMEYFLNSWLAMRGSVYSHYSSETYKTEGTPSDNVEVNSDFYDVFWTVGLGVDKTTWGLDIALEEDQFHSGYILSNSSDVGDAFALVTAWLRW